ncbi:MAG: heavy-metal-associated domain-containing protein [Anaerolineales bacterium]|nr:heavy-metal-associated domain-containing protein [Anaerolineales bacterium]
MKVMTIDLPAMYGDHHVVEVRRILLEIPGVDEVYASSAFRAAEVRFDPDQASDEVIRAKLDDAGYLTELPIPEEVPAQSASTGMGKKGFYRYTAAHETSRQVIGFGQTIIHSGHGLWPCPGMSPIKGIPED